MKRQEVETQWAETHYNTFMFCNQEPKQFNVDSDVS